MPWKHWNKKRMSAVLPELPGKPVTVETWHPEDLENSQCVHSMSILYAGIQVHRIYYACADHLIYCQGLLPGAARPAACSENVGFIARTQDICEHTQSPILLRLPKRKYRNHSQISAFRLVPRLSAGRDRLLGWSKCSYLSILWACIARKLVYTSQSPRDNCEQMRANSQCFNRAGLPLHHTADTLAPNELWWLQL